MVATDKLPTPQGKPRLTYQLIYRATSSSGPALDGAIPVTYPDKIYEAMRYSLLAGASVYVPFFALLLVKWLEARWKWRCQRLVLEMIHTMSLIHDDLPRWIMTITGGVN